MIFIFFIVFCCFFFGVVFVVVVFVLVVVQNDLFFSGFKKVFEFIVEVDGEQDKGVEIFYQVCILVYFVVLDSLSVLVLIMLCMKQVQLVLLMKMMCCGELIDLVVDVIFGIVGMFEQQGMSVFFDVDGKNFVMCDKLVLFGLMCVFGFEKYNSSYMMFVEVYVLDGDVMEVFKKDSCDVWVCVYFGLWCLFCLCYVLCMIKVNKDFVGFNIKIDYYGLLCNFDEDKVVVDVMKFIGVLMGVVFIDGKEVGCIKGEFWKVFEQLFKCIVEVCCQVMMLVCGGQGCLWFCSLWVGGGFFVSLW